MEATGNNNEVGVLEATMFCGQAGMLIQPRSDTPPTKADFVAAILIFAHQFLLGKSFALNHCTRKGQLSVCADLRDSACLSSWQLTMATPHASTRSICTLSLSERLIFCHSGHFGPLSEGQERQEHVTHRKVLEFNHICLPLSSGRLCSVGRQQGPTRTRDP